MLNFILCLKFNTSFYLFLKHYIINNVYILLGFRNTKLTFLQIREILIIIMKSITKCKCNFIKEISHFILIYSKPFKKDCSIKIPFINNCSERWCLSNM